ncbi:stalk domain-containing protein [Paenibacillus tarimensis]
MKKTVITLVAAAAIAVQTTPLTFAQNAQTANSPIKISVNGHFIDLADEPAVRDGRVFIPVREMMTVPAINTGNLKIAWNKTDQTVTIENGGTTVSLQVGSRTAEVEGKSVTLPAAPYYSLSNQRVYVPASFLESVFGKQVAWNTGDKTVEITTSNADKVVAVLKSFETGDTTALEMYINPETYIQHNLAFPSGRETIINAVAQLKGAGVQYDIKRVFTDGDYVVVHSEVTFGDSPAAVFDVFRIENGLIVEHWDNFQVMPEESVNGRTLVDGATEVTDLDKTEENKALIKEFFDNVFFGQNPDLLPTYFDGDNYIQHNPLVADGVSSLMEAFAALAEQGVTITYEKVHYIHGQGNFVLVMSEVNFDGQPTAVYDMYRIENGKIAEHWDIVEPILPEDQRANSNGKF